MSVMSTCLLLHSPYHNMKILFVHIGLYLISCTWFHEHWYHIYLVHFHTSSIYCSTQHTACTLRRSNEIGIKPMQIYTNLPTSQFYSHHFLSLGEQYKLCSTNIPLHPQRDSSTNSSNTTPGVNSIPLVLYSTLFDYFTPDGFF